MTDDLTPPPDEPLAEQSRARIRADLLASAQARSGSGPRPWLVPVVAAAAVLTVVGLGAWAVRAGDDGGPTVAPSSTGSTAGSVASDPVPSEPSGKATLQQSSCYDPVTRVLPGAQQAVEFPADDVAGDTSIWVAGTTFALCDVRAGRTIVHKPISMTRPDGVEPFQVSSTYPRTPDGFRTVQVAGGVVPEGLMAFDVRYTFPDGHTEVAATTQDDHGRTWWRMVYAYDDPAESQLDRTPIQVVVSYSGVQKSYELEQGEETCAQVNTDC